MWVNVALSVVCAWLLTAIGTGCVIGRAVRIADLREAGRSPGIASIPADRHPSVR